MSQATAKPSSTLTTRQKAFADLWIAAKVRGADFDQAELAKAAGYSGNRDVLHVSASRNLATPSVREYLHSKAREHLRDGAFDVALTLRSLSTGARSERVRADVASRLAVGLQLIDGEQADRGPAVAIQIVFKTDAGALLTQPVVVQHEPQAISHIESAGHSLDEGEGKAKGRRGRQPATPPPGRAGDAEGGPGVKNRALKSSAGSPPRRASPKVSGKNPGSGKSRGGSGG